MTVIEKKDKKTTETEIDFQSMIPSPTSDREVELYERRRTEELERQRRARLLEHYRSEASGVGMKFWDMELPDFIADTPEKKSALEAVKKFVAEPENRIMLLCGSYGTGKTMLESLCVRELGGCYITAFRLCTEFASGSDFKSRRSKLQVLDFYSRLPFLAVDELEDAGDVLALRNIVMERYENGLPTALATNLTKLEAVKFLGAKMFDRLNEVCTSLEMGWESYRKKLRKELA
jgi:DNA replication protein DnaC